MVCEWFALCDHPADGVRTHPILGAVLICTRCADRVGDPITQGERETLQAATTGEDTSEDWCTEHGFEECPDCGNGGVKIGADGYEPCTRFRGCWSD